MIFGVRVAEHEVRVALVERRLEQAVELAAEDVGERDTARGTLRLRRAELAAHEIAAHADAARRPVDVAPAQREQLALAHPAHRRGEVQHALDPPDAIGRDGGQEGVELGLVEEPDISVDVHRLGLLHALARVARRPAAPDVVLEDAVQQTKVVERRFTDWRLRRLAAMNASTSLGPISASGRSPKNGARCTRRNDS